MKLDIEGLEYPALMGAKGLLRDASRAPCSIISEVNPGLTLRLKQDRCVSVCVLCVCFFSVSETISTTVTLDVCLH